MKLQKVYHSGIPVDKTEDRRRSTGSRPSIRSSILYSRPIWS